MKELWRNPEDFYRILETTVSNLDLQEMLTKVVGELCEFIGSKRCILFVLNTEKKELYSKVVQGCTVTEIKLPVNKTNLAGYTALTDKELSVNDASELKKIDPELSFDSSFHNICDFTIGNLISIPIRFKGSIIGVFQAINKPGGFLGRDVEALREFALILGLALNNALIVEDLKRCTSEKDACLLEKNQL